MRIEFELLENGLDFIAYGQDQISSAENKRDLKYGVLHLSSGAELILKARLEREDWRLVFSQPDQADKRRYRAGDFKSVDCEKCLKRLEDAGIALDEKKKQSLLSFRRRRNRFEHFSIADTKEAIESASVEVLSVILDFIREEFEACKLSAAEIELLGKIRASLQEFSQFCEHRLAAIRPQLEEAKSSYGGIIQCPSCLQETLKPDESVECLFCGYRDGADAAAELYAANVLGESRYRALKEGYDFPIYTCPNCDNKALVDGGITGGMLPAIQFTCFGCGSKWSEGLLRVCPLCLAARDPDGFVGDQCSDCFRAYVERDNT